MTKVACGPDGSFQPGDTRDVPDSKGADLVRAGAAINISPKAAPQPEAAVIAEPERAVMPSVKGKRR